MPDEITDAEFKDVSPQPQTAQEGALPSDISPVQPGQVEATEPLLNGQPIKQVRFLDYGEIRVVFDAATGGVIGVMAAKKTKKVK